MATAFGTMLGERIKAAGMTLRGFAAEVSLAHTTIARVVSGKRTPPLDQIERWAKVLRLDGSDKAEFVELGRSARAKGKRDSAGYIEELEERADAAEALLVSIAEFLSKKGIKLPQELVKAIEALKEAP